jgi:regulatory protein
MQYSARILTVRAQTTAELRAKLTRRAANKQDVEQAIQRLQDGGVLNDQKFATSFADWRRDSQGHGQGRVMRDLLARRVPAELAKTSAAAAYSGTDEIAMIEQFLKRKYRGKNLGDLLDRKNPDKQKHLASAFRKLRQAGFSSGNSIKALKRHSTDAERLEEMDEGEAESAEAAGGN